MDRAARDVLLRLARRSVAEAARAGRSAGSKEDGKAGPDLPDDPDLRTPRAAFVTLHAADGSVRGCVGTTAAQKPLAQVVHDMAQAAALRDPRFEPVAPEEVPMLRFEISVLEPPVRVKSLDAIEIGKDGLLVVGRGRRGLLLPQVAEERHWDARTFAENTCKKAGLETGAYRADDVELYKFGAEVFSEEPAPRPSP